MNENEENKRLYSVARVSRPALTSTRDALATDRVLARAVLTMSDRIQHAVVDY